MTEQHIMTKWSNNAGLHRHITPLGLLL